MTTRMRTKRFALTALILSLVAIAVAYAAAFLPGGAPGWSAWPMAWGTAGCMVATLTLGAVKEGGVGRLAIPFALVFVLLAGGFSLVLVLPDGGAALWLGLPPRAAVLLYGVGLLPFLVVPVAYALTFDERTLSRADLDRIRAAARARRGRTDHRSAAGGTTERGG